MEHYRTDSGRPPLSGRRRAPARKFILLLAALLISGAALEGLYRGYWAFRNRAAHGDAGGYFDLYVVGESTARGEPYDPGITLAGLVSGMFRGRLLEREIRVHTLARQGESIYPQSVAFRQSLRGRRAGNPGAVLIYSGNNDAGPGRGMTALQRLRFGVLSRSMILEDLFFQAEKNFPAFRARSMDTYERHLRAVVEAALGAGLVPVLSTVASNLSDIDPALPREDLGSEGAAALAKGSGMEAAGKNQEAARFYLAQAERLPRMRPYLKYRAAKCLRALGRYSEARENFEAAAEGSAPDNFGRASAAQNERVRSLARKYSVPLVDAVEIFRERSPGGLIGGALFSDGHHPNVSGYLLLAEGYAGRLSAIFGEPVSRRYAGPPDVFREFSYGKEQQAAALLQSGSWYFSVAATHALPAERLGLARARYEEALKLEAGSFYAWLGLGLVEASLRSGLLSDPEGLAWLGENGLFYGFLTDLTEDRLRGIIERFSAGGVPWHITDKVAVCGRRLIARGAAHRADAAGPEARKESKRLADSAVDKLRAGDEKEGGRLLEAALKTDPDNPEALATLCWLLERKEKSAEAATACRRAAYAVTSAPGIQTPGMKRLAAGAAFNEARLLYSGGRISEAVAALNEFLEKAPDGWPGAEAAAALLERILRETGRKPAPAAVQNPAP